MPKADEKLNGLTLLGHSESALPGAPTEKTLEIFPNRSTDRDYWITLEAADFTSVCPVTGQPDFARIKIQYVPGESCVETKSLKFYLASYRNVPSFNEEVVNRIANDLAQRCRPRRLIVRGEFASRGGIALSAEVHYPFQTEPITLSGTGNRP